MNNMNMGSVRNNLIYIVLLVGMGIFLFVTFSRNRETVPMMDIGQVAQQARDGKVKRIAVDGEELTVTMADDKKVRSRKEETGSVVETLRNLGVPESAFGSGANQIQIIVKAPSIWQHFAAGGFGVARVVPGRLLLLHHAPGAGRRQPGLHLRQEPCAHVHRRPAHRHLRRRGRRRRGQAGARRRSSSSSRSRRSSPRWARASPRACCWSARPAPARR